MVGDVAEKSLTPEPVGQSVERNRSSQAFRPLVIYMFIDRLMLTVVRHSVVPQIESEPLEIDPGTQIGQSRMNKHDRFVVQTVRDSVYGRPGPLTTGLQDEPVQLGLLTSPGYRNSVRQGFNNCLCGVVCVAAEGIE